MLENPLQSVSKFVLDIAKHGEVALSSKQQALVSRLITAMVLLGSFKITAVSSLFLMKISPAAVYAMLRRSALPFDRLFWGCLKLVIKLFKIRSIYITIDDTERERSKNCRILPFVRKTLCKATGGWVQAQNIVFIVLVTHELPHFFRTVLLASVCHNYFVSASRSFVSQRGMETYPVVEHLNPFKNRSLSLLNFSDTNFI